MVACAVSLDLPSMGIIICVAQCHHHRAQTHSFFFLVRDLHSSRGMRSARSARVGGRWRESEVQDQKAVKCCSIIRVTNLPLYIYTPPRAGNDQIPVAGHYASVFPILGRMLHLWHMRQRVETVGPRSEQCANHMHMPAHPVHAHQAVEIFHDRSRRARDLQRIHCQRDSRLHSTRSAQCSNHVSTAPRVAFHGYSRIPLQLGMVRRLSPADYLLSWSAGNNQASHRSCPRWPGAGGQCVGPAEILRGRSRFSSVSDLQ